MRAIADSLRKEFTIVSVNSSIGAQGQAAWRAGRMGSLMTFDLDYAGRDRALKTRCASLASDSFELQTADSGNRSGAFTLQDKVSRGLPGLIGTEHSGGAPNNKVV
ncbi:hypothetical protein SRHO_G00269170 [Serrasalmus rhombeus]